DVAEILRSSRLEQQQVFEQGSSRAEQSFGLFGALGSGAVAFRGAELRGVVGLLHGSAQQEESVGPAGNPGRQIKAESAADRAFRQTANQRAFRRLQSRAALGEQALDLLCRNRPEPEDARTGADRREQFTGVFRQQDDRSVGWWLLEHLQEGVRRLLHESRAGEDVERSPRLSRDAVDLADQRAHLADLDEQL